MHNNYSYWILVPLCFPQGYVRPWSAHTSEACQLSSVEA